MSPLLVKQTEQSQFITNNKQPVLLHTLVIYCVYILNMAAFQPTLPCPLQLAKAKLHHTQD